MSDVETQEREKYEYAWTWAKYRKTSSGLPVVDEAVLSMGCVPGETLIDWGCGSGKAAAALQARGLKVTGFDIAKNCLNKGIDIPLITGTLWNPPKGLKADYAFCTDVLEHVPEEHIDAALQSIRERTKKAAYIQVDTVLDLSGPRMNPPVRLHLCVHDSGWWNDKLKQYWEVVKEVPAAFSRAGFVCK